MKSNFSSFKKLKENVELLESLGRILSRNEIVSEGK